MLHSVSRCMSFSAGKALHSMSAAIREYHAVGAGNATQHIDQSHVFVAAFYTPADRLWICTLVLD